MIGVQEPRILWVPDYVSSAGEEVIDLARMAGLILDPWQQLSVKHALGERKDGKWAAFEVGIIVPRQNGKGPHALNTPILTTDGWTTVGEIRVGQHVYGADGTPTRVVACSPIYRDERCYEVEFTDGSRHVVGGGHLWSVRRKDSQPWRVLDTESLATSVGARRADNGRMEYNWRVRCDAVPRTAESELPIDPYVFGLWLGDGKSSAAVLTVGDEDLEYMRSALVGAGCTVASEWQGNAEWKPTNVSFNLGRKGARDGFLSRLRSLGVYDNKHIPEIYLTASPAQRLALLRGLMDTDGSIACTNRSPQAEFTTSHEPLARGFHRLARSLGIRVSPKVRQTTHKDNWRFLWTPTFNPFQMPRKAQHFRMPTSRRHELMSITAIRPVATVPTRCIQIANADGVYLVGHHFTPTHNSILEALELGGLFLLGERLIIHSAHQFDTSLEAFNRLLFLVENTAEFSRRVKKVTRTHGEEGIHLTNGQRIRFRTRTKGGGRGFTCDRLILDEAMILPLAAHGALLPTLSARPNPQVIYAASAVDQLVHEHGLVLARVRKRGIAGDDQSLAYLEWSPRYELTQLTETVRRDPKVWAIANPSFNVRITHEHVERESNSMDPRTFAVERLNIGDWPDPDQEDAIIPIAAFMALIDRESKPEDPVCFAVDVPPDRSMGAIACSGRREDGLKHTEVVDHRRGTSWIAERLRDLRDKHNPVAIVLDASGPAGALLPELQNLEVEVITVSGKEHAQACGMYYDACIGISDDDIEADAAAAERAERWGEPERKPHPPTLRHLGNPELVAALKGSSTRPLADAWVWGRKNSTVDISPLVASTLSHWGLETQRPVDVEPLMAWI